MPRPALLLAVLGLTIAASGCDTEPPAAATAPAAMEDAASAGSERAEVLGPFLDGHFAFPVPLQGEPPEGFSPLEASLAPEDCGACHPQQLADWSTSLHAKAFSPGFAGQLIEGRLAKPAALRNCQTCHTPLEEQQPVDAAGQPAAAHDPALRAQGIVCASCHVRAHRRFGPERRPELPPLAEPVPHRGFEVREEFGEGRFCAPCHQFFDDTGVNGKPIENTFQEWQASPQAAEGRTCQSCHMPDRRHLWRGIHDPDMVRGAIDVELFVEPATDGEVRAALVLRNRDVGHAFPTYVTPRIWLRVWQEDEAGARVAGSEVESALGRSVDFSKWEEVFDTRVLPGEQVKLDYARPRAAGATAVAAEVVVDPDFHYRGVFESLSRSLDDPGARRLIGEALAAARTSSFTIFEQRAPIATEGS